MWCQDLGLQLDKLHLAKLTNENVEIRTRAFEQVEKLLKESSIPSNFKPVYLAKQLIRWFGLKPLVYPKRVLLVLFSLLSSEYRDCIIAKITCERLEAEVEKMRIILEQNNAADSVEVLLKISQCFSNKEEELHEHSWSTSVSVGTDLVETVDSVHNFECDNDWESFPFKITTDDFELAWGCSGVDDKAIMKNFVDALMLEKLGDEEMLSYLKHLYIKLIDFPPEYLLRAPYVFLSLLTVQQQSDSCLQLINRILISFVLRLQERIRVRNSSDSIRVQSIAHQKPQLRIVSAMRLLLESCITLLDPVVLCANSNHWHLIQLTIESLYTLLSHPDGVPDCIIQQMGKIVEKLLCFFNSYDYSEMVNAVSNIAIPRANSLIFNEMLCDILAHNIKYSLDMDKAAAKACLRYIILDCSYFSAYHARRQALVDLSYKLGQSKEGGDENLVILAVAYVAALAQLTPEKAVKDKVLLQRHSSICHVLVQMGSETLLRQFVDAIIECIPLFENDYKLREQAESVICNLIELPDQELKASALNMMTRAVVDHFQAIMNETRYLPCFSNEELLRQKIFGLPIGVSLVRRMLVLSWSDEQVQQWISDYIIRLLRLCSILDVDDIGQLIDIITINLPLIVYRASTMPTLHKLVWEFLDPDNRSIPSIDAIRGNLTYMFCDNSQLREDATARVAYALSCQENASLFEPNIDSVLVISMGSNISVLPSPVSFHEIFKSSSLPRELDKQGVQHLLSFLRTPGLKPAIRKSTLKQLSNIMEIYQAVNEFIDLDGHVVLMETLHTALLRNSCNQEWVQCLAPTINILLKLLCYSQVFRAQMVETFEVHTYLLRALFLEPHHIELRRDICTCLFLLLFHKIITTSSSMLFSIIDFSSLCVPVTYKTEKMPSDTRVIRGVELEKTLQCTHFNNCGETSARFWRMHVAQALNNKEHGKIDVRESLTTLMKPELALLLATQTEVQINRYLTDAINCTNHETLLRLLGNLKLYMVMKRCDLPLKQRKLLWELMHKYLPLSPVNVSDIRLYTSLLELCYICTHFGMSEVTYGLTTAFEADRHHSFLTLVSDHNVDVSTIQMLSECIRKVVCASNTAYNWHYDLFKNLGKLSSVQFGLRMLAQARCLLNVMVGLSSRHMTLTDIDIQANCQYFMELSMNLRNKSCVAAQWHRDCLLITCKVLSSSRTQSLTLFKSEDSACKILRYVLGLTDHIDYEIRCLAWTLLGTWCRYNAKQVADLIPRVNFIADGLAGVSIYTLQDVQEPMIIREMAGRACAQIMEKMEPATCLDLFKRAMCLSDASEGLRSLVVNGKLQSEFEQRDSQAPTSFTIIDIYVSLCMRLMLRQPEWTKELVQHAFYHGLSDVMKVTPPECPERHLAFLQMCVHISELYAVCSLTCFEDLQRTICRDPPLIRSFFLMIQGIFAYTTLISVLLPPMVKLLMVLCRDTSGLTIVSNLIKEMPDTILGLLTYSMDVPHMNTQLQSYAMALLLVMIVRSQEISDKESNLINIFELHPVETSGILISESENAENHKSNAICPRQKSNLAVLIYLALNRIFQCSFPLQTYNFLKPPGPQAVQICETLGALLKYSPEAVIAARNTKLLENVLSLLESFLNDKNIGNAITYVRRVGAHKTNDIICNLMIMINMLMQWHSAHSSVITNADVAARIVHMLLNIWPWLSHSVQLKQITIRLAIFLTECSLLMCKQTSIIMTNQSHSLLQLMVRVADHDTTKIETPSSHIANTCADVALRVMLNCCACNEGRQALMKMNVLDMFDNILPGSGSNTSNIYRTKPQLLNHWLIFWEIYSRYETGAGACHLRGLFMLIRRLPPLDKNRLLCLRILRNMCFLNTNRIIFVGKSDILMLIRSIIKTPVQRRNQQEQEGTRAEGGDDGTTTSVDSYQEHRLATLCVWKLFGFSAKYKALLRGSKLVNDLTLLQMDLSALENESTDEYESTPYAKSLHEMLDDFFNTLNAN